MVRRLSAVRRPDAWACGSKAACLGELLALGYAVPPALVLPTIIYTDFLRANGLAGFAADREAESRVAHPRRLVAIERDVEAAFAQATLQPHVQAAVAEWMEAASVDSVAVRSSATAEDLPGASFAGLYCSYLGVQRRDVATAVVRCFASLFTARAALYRRLKGVRDVGAMAVIVQQFVSPEHAGVAFTVAPRRPRTVLVEAAVGTGEAVVSGAVSPSRYYLDRDTLSIEESCERVAVDTESVRAVARQALSIEAAFGVPQDVEFGVIGRVVHILQARPATAPVSG